MEQYILATALALMSKPASPMGVCKDIDTHAPVKVETLSCDYKNSSFVRQRYKGSSRGSFLIYSFDCKLKNKPVLLEFEIHPAYRNANVIIKDTDDKTLCVAMFNATIEDGAKS